MLAAVRDSVDRYDLFQPGDAIVVAVSGGPDSLCLLHVLHVLRQELDITLHVAHLNHRLRGAESDADAAFVRQLAASWELPYTIAEIDVTQLVAEGKEGEEEAARHARYSFLARVAHQIGASVVAVGHNADDQAETVLMHLMRGSGLAGLRGMAPRSLLGDLPLALIRPLLHVSRADIETYCRQQDLQPRLDRSNLDRTYFRNRLRHQILPALDQVAPGVHRRLCQLAELVAADQELLQAMIDELWPTLVIEAGDEFLALDLTAWRKLPLGLRRRALRRAAFQLRPDLRDLGFAQVEAARQVAETGTTGARVSLPGRLSLAVSYERLCISGVDYVLLPPPAWPALSPDMIIPLVIPGATPLPGDWRLEATLLSASDEALTAARQNDDPWRAFLDADRAGSGLVLRTRQPGDRFQPLGMAGRTASLSDFMINLRIPSAWRDQIPILARPTAPNSGPGEILWIAGWRLDERVRVHPASRRILRLDLCRPAELP